jgi:hypothetical protein
MAQALGGDPVNVAEQNRTHVYDIRLSRALIDERRLMDIFQHANIEKIELKSESFQWEQTGNIAIEYEDDGHPSGIASTEASVWVHELKRDGETLVYLMFPIERLREGDRMDVSS